MLSRKMSHDEKVAFLIDSFTLTFATHGLDGSPVKLLAKEADMIESLIYRYFPSKTEITVKCTQYTNTKIQSELVQLLSENLETLSEGAQVLLDYIDSVLPLYRFLLNALSHPIFGKSLQKDNEEDTQGRAEFMERFQAHYGLPREQARLALTCLQNTIHSYVLFGNKDDYFAQYALIMSVLEKK